MQRENKWQDRFDKKFPCNKESDAYYFNPYLHEMKLFIQSEIDTAIAEERDRLWNDANGIVALFGAILMSKGIVGEEKETIKECLASAIKNVLKK